MDMPPRRLLSTSTTRTADTGSSHHCKRILRSSAHDAHATEEQEQDAKKKKRQMIAPSPLPPPAAWVDNSNEVLERVVAASITQSPLCWPPLLWWLDNHLDGSC
jgi:hypothetical protein